MRQRKRSGAASRRFFILGVAVLFLVLVVSRNVFEPLFVHSRLESSINDLREQTRVVEQAANTEENEKTLVVVIGSLRGGELAWKSLKTNVLDVNRADLALLIAKPRREYRHASVFRLARYHWPIQEFDDWADAIDLIFNGDRSWRPRFYATAPRASKIFGGIRYPNATASSSPGLKPEYYPGSVAIQMMLRFLLSQKIRQFNLTSIYDRFIITRADHYYLCGHNVSKLDQAHLWIPEGEHFGGYTDRHLIVGKSLVLQALDIFPHLFHDHFELVGSRLNPERLVKRIWDSMNLSVRMFPRVMFTCASPGDVPSSLGRQMGKKKVVQGVHLKYANEYSLSHNGCELPLPKQWYPRTFGEHVGRTLRHAKRIVLGL